MHMTSRMGERGASILGALVIALMLGGGALAASELAGTTPVAESDNAQLAATTASVKPTDAKKLKAEVSKKCEELKERLTGRPNGTQLPAKSTTELKSMEENVEKYRCVSAYVKDSKKGKAGIECAGLLSKMQWDGKKWSVVSEPLRGKGGEDLTGVCESAFFDNKGNELDPNNADDAKKLEAFLKDTSAEQKKDLVDLVGKGNIDPRVADPLNEALYGDLEGLDKKIADQVKKVDTAEKELEDLTAGCGVAYCKDTDIQAAKDKLAAEEKKLKDLEEQAGRLARDQRRLEALKKETAPPPGCKTPPCTIYKGPGNTGLTPGASPSGFPSTFPKQQPGGGSDGGGGAQQCPTQYICQNNALYVRQTNCQQQLVQQCQYGCTNGATTCSVTPQCLQAPPQPKASECSNGTWKALYGGANNACVVGWKCEPTTPSDPDAPKAELACQPKVLDVGMELSITWSCSKGTSTGSGFDTEGKLSGAMSTVIATLPGNTNKATYALTCTNESKKATAECTVQVAKPNIVLVANPKSVPTGETSNIGWVTSGMDKCVISSVSQDKASELGFPGSIVHLSAFTSQNADKTEVNGAAKTPPLTAVNNVSTLYGFLLGCDTLGGAKKKATTTVEATPN